MSRVEVQRALARMAHEIIERNGGVDELLLAGIPTRGVHLAERLADLIASYESKRPFTTPLDTTEFRDDSHHRPVPRSRQQAKNGAEKLNVTGMRVVVIDDVFHTGRTARAALDALVQYGRPSYVQLGVLVNRGHRELPISPDFVGKNIPTSRTERVQVKLKEVDGLDGVTISRGWNNSKERATIG